MLFDWGWSELMLIGIVALVVIGPKDLPKAMRVAGYWMRKARNLSRELQDQVEEMMRESELAEMRDELKKAGQIDLGHDIEDAAGPHDGLAAGAPSAGLADFPDMASHPSVAEATGDVGIEATGPEDPPEPEAAIPGAARYPYRKAGIPGFRVRLAPGPRNDVGQGLAEDPVAAEPALAAQEAAPPKP